jgi:hypothetical protein
MFINEHYTPGELVEGAKCSVSLEFQLGHPAVDKECALQMWEE